MSTSGYPKHLLQLTNQKSLLQNTYERAKRLSGDIYIISEDSHIEHVYQQLPDLPRENFIVEPGRRGTASCVIAALARIQSQHQPDEVVAFMHADHHIRDTESFVTVLRQAADVSVGQNRIVLLGLEPTHPATGFGYIERGEQANGGLLHTVASFKEKPDRGTAERYVQSGNYLWNMGYFVAPISVFERNLEQYAPHLWQNYQKLCQIEDEEERRQHYLSFDSEPIDTALIERVNDLLVMPGSFDWMDVGSYPDVHLVNKQDADGNTLSGRVEAEHVTNSFVRNDTDVPVVVIGLDNVAVVATPDGILVTNKSHAQKVGDIAKRLTQQN